ncbi:hypothetical protein J3R83DRAFT_4051 [Lanmaoa asiatica]|nr:hypothetical protein J3R83DRAFT_4051 [Lanmaoa asiatica]
MLSLSKRFDQDRGAQQVGQGGARVTGRPVERDVAGPSRSRGPLSGEVHFRSQHAPVPELEQEAARFFGVGPIPVPHTFQVPMSTMSTPARPFDVAGLRDALPIAVPVAAAPVQRAQIDGPSNATWAADFLACQPMMSQTHTPTQAQGQAQGHAQVRAIPATRAVEMHQDRVQNLASPRGGMQNTPDLPVVGVEMSWDKEFQSQESLLNASGPELSEVLPEQQQQQRQQDDKDTVPADEMARLAAQVIDSVKHEQNPKFQKSEFMNLMHQLRDGEVTVEEDNIVPKDFVTTMATDGSEELNASYVQQAKDPHEAYFRQENADFTEYWNAHYTGPAAHTLSAIQGSRTWNGMQRDWDAFEATTTGVKPIENYQFQTNNPYLLGDSTRTRHHALHMSHSQRVYENVLELEAAVQRDPTNATAWFELGVKQQENEREAKAIQALQRAIDLDPSHLPTWLALSVSYTNDSHRMGTYDAIREWVLRNPKYEAGRIGLKFGHEHTR